ncbi:putative HTH-type transcriptional regulator [Marmoricola endophyticus]|uniref:HTH-type transcriptional regulator n=1 Tax=Marmoricola endophyticus TaxID=2040280 RepID=A0A917F1Y1_9ACTN|nr:MarR family transcriptional regulator [Marmoricola endophyticus]GGF41926.1 putative HTH-type transcriptional regulator [Marmoricola endophyticus]
MTTQRADTRSGAGLASELRMSVMRLRRRLVAERDPGNRLSARALSVLWVLRREGESTVGQLADHERVRPPSMTRTVAALVEDGLVCRRTSDDDRRQVLVSISEQGLAMLAADRRRRDAWLARRLAELTPDERAVLREAAPLIERLADAD